MSYLTEKKFSFVSSALESDTFAVVQFKGSEALSKPYEFEIMLVTEQSDIDLNSVLQQPASFTFHREDGEDVIWNGIVARFEQLHNFNIYTFYRAVLVPKLWWLQLTYHNQIFLDKTINEILEAVLKDGGLTSLDFEFKLQNDYQKFDYVCQYEESHYDFLSRWMEREGLYYYFEQTENGEKVIITDTNMAHTGMPLGDTLYYSPPSGLATLHRTEVIQSFTCRQQLIPSKVFLKDYNYETPSLSVTGSADVDSSGRGNVYYYGENFRNSTEGNRLAKIRSEEILCRKEQYVGESTVPFIMPGYSFTLEDHYRPDFNKEYLTIGVDFSGSQTGYLIAGIKQALSEREERVYYSNTFTAIPYDIQFRTERRTKKSKIYGTLPAKIDAAGSGQYAELDSQGRYKVVMPFDESGRQNGRASIWLRMVQPYAGSGHGMHFPLHKGTEVMIAFTDGDPDRPIIAGAVPNPETSNMVNVNNQTQSVIQTGSSNRVAIEDKVGDERILVHNPSQASYIRIGIHNDPPPKGETSSATESADRQKKAPKKEEEESEGGEESGTGEGTGEEETTAGEEDTGSKDGFLDLEGTVFQAKNNGVHICTLKGLGSSFDVAASMTHEVVLGAKASIVGGGVFDLLINPLSLIRKRDEQTWFKAISFPLLAPFWILYDAYKEMKGRGFGMWDALKFVGRLTKTEIIIGNEFAYHQGDQFEVGGEFKRNSVGEIEHRSDELVKNICDGGDSIAPPNQLHHNVTVDTKGASMYGKKIHLKANATGKAQKRRIGKKDVYQEQNPTRELIMSQDDGIRLKAKEGGNFSEIVMDHEEFEIRVKGQKTSRINMGADIAIKADNIKINHLIIDKTNFKAANGALKVQGGKVMLG
jgi:type VI secretion system secreted protein VgrG